MQAYVATVRAITIVAATVWTGDMYIQLVTAALLGYIESAEQSRTAEHFWLAAYSASKSDNKTV